MASPPRGAAETFAARLAPLEAIQQGEGALPTESAMLRSKDALVLAGLVAAGHDPPRGAAETLVAYHDPPRGAAETLVAETFAARLAPLEALLQPCQTGDAGTGRRLVNV